MGKIGKTISDLLKDLKSTRLCLPEFQRDFVWKPRQIADLMMSILRAYPIGWFLYLDYRRNSHIEPRPIADTKIYDKKDCKLLVLDGQQRLTSIYKVFNPAEKGIFEYRNMHCFLYIKVDKIEHDKIHNLQNQFISVGLFRNKDRCLNYLNDMELQIKRREIAFWVFLDKAELSCWIRKARNIITKRQIRTLKLLRQKLNKYDISHDIIHEKIENISLCNIFEKINSTGTRLNIFDLKVADFEKFNIDLRNLWRATKSEHPDFQKLDIDPIYMLKIITLARKAIHHQRDIKRVTCSEQDISNLSDLYEAKQFKKVFESDWRKATKFLQETIDYYSSNYGVDRAPKNPYSPMLITYASLLWWVEEKGEFRAHELIEKLSIWYWRSVFGRRYEKSTNSVVSNDFFLLRMWIAGKIKRVPREFPKCQAIDLEKISSSRDAVYRAVLCLPSSNKAQDLMKPRQGSCVEDHHIFPKKWLERRKFDIKSDLVNCVLNRTYILAEVNVAISDKTPSEYFFEFSENIYNKKLSHNLRNNLAKHFINEDTLRHIQRNDFRKFVKEREKLIQREIQRKTKS